MILFAIVYFSLMMIEIYQYNSYKWSEFWPVGVGSYLMVLGVIFTNYSVAYGKAGPA